MTWTRPPRGENLMALERRLPSSWCRRVGSPKIGTSSPGSMVSTTPATVADV